VTTHEDGTLAARMTEMRASRAAGFVGQSGVHVDGAEVVIDCDYDANSRVWLGREDSFDVRAPYFVTSSSLATVHAGEPWSGIGSIWRSLTVRDG